MYRYIFNAEEFNPKDADDYDDWSQDYSSLDPKPGGKYTYIFTCLHDPNKYVKNFDGYFSEYTEKGCFDSDTEALMYAMAITFPYNHITSFFSRHPEAIKLITPQKVDKAITKEVSYCLSRYGLYGPFVITVKNQSTGKVLFDNHKYDKKILGRWW